MKTASTENRVLIVVAAVGFAVFAWLLLAPPQCSEPEARPDAAIVDAAVPDAAVIVDAMLPDAFSVNDETVTVDELKRIGMLGRSGRHLEALFEGRPNWTRDPRAPATWVNQNDVRLSFKIRGGRVQSIGAEFPEEGTSADLTVLSEFIVGQQDAMPLRMEIFSPEEQILTQGAFEDALGRKMYFRAEMRREGQPPWGPKTFEIADTPWPGQSDALTPVELLPGYDGADPTAPTPPPDYHEPQPVDDSQFDPSQAL